MRAFAILALLLTTAIGAFAGVTIHYTGVAESATGVSQVLSAAKEYAAKQKWQVDDASAVRGTLRRVEGENEKMIETGIRGIRITVAPMCEPLFLQFGGDFVMQDFVKTQYSGPEAHIAVVGLFESIMPLMKSLSITDEGEYWGSHQRIALLRNLEAVDLMLKDIKKRFPEARGPIVLPNGRIIDVTK